MSVTPFFGWLLVGFLLVSGVYATQSQLELLKSNRPASGTFRYLPKGSVLKVGVLGYDQLAADLLWLKIVQVMGQKGREQEDAEWIAEALDVVATLDPRFDYPIQLGSIFLSVLAGRADLAVPLLEKGTSANPDNWRLYFFLGFNQFYYLGNFREAAAAMSMAAELPGRPDYVPLLATRLYAQAEEPDLALAFLDRMYQMNKDEQVRAQLVERMKEVTAERDLLLLAKAVELFRDRAGREPENLQELVSGQILRALPPEPFGGRYYLDANDHHVKSTIYTERLRVKLPEKRLGAPQQPDTPDTP